MSNYDFTIQQGATFNPQLKFSQPQFSVKAITAITKSGQAVLTATAHGLTVDWPVWIVGVLGMDQINHRADELRNPSKAYLGYFVDANTIRLNVDSSRFAVYISGGELLYHPPVDLTGFTARMDIRGTLSSATAIHTLTTENGGIALGGVAGTIDLLIPAATTEGFDFGSAVYDLELISAAGVVTRLIGGAIVLSKEVTRV
jgi:hypothetical protein